MPPNYNAPPCPAWCEQSAHGWNVDLAAVTKTCRHVFDGGPVRLILERFASVEGVMVTVEQPLIRIEIDDDTLSIDAARYLAATMQRATDLVGEAAAAA